MAQLLCQVGEVGVRFYVYCVLCYSFFDICYGGIIVDI